MKKFQYKSTMQIPTIDKVVVNVGCGKEANGNAKVIESVVRDIAAITGQKPVEMCIRDRQVTVQNLDVVKVDAELNLIAVCGAVPGPKGGIVVLKNTVKNNKVAKGEAGISKNPQKASARK